MTTARQDGLREAATFLLWAYDQKQPVADAHEAWKALRAALSDTSPLANDTGALKEKIRTALYEGLEWFGTLPEPEGDVPEHYHRWDDLGELADRIAAALSPDDGEGK